ncbi:TPM domain-containing protein [Sphingomonas sp. HHU CXW]|uniref:TPM domain-containing protein n=1 Tax=Sphingomonas hominis TaxID=2741495 RepID=A0ABX2JG63_9SPHN|nr:TPM domain-containing protein [Sphingomonas hominis]NTS64764.1 TPM domain-containing protein [Sphingomonas hominis]
MTRLFRSLLTLLLVALAWPAAAQTFPKLTGRVVDAAHLLSPEQVQQLTQLSAGVEQASTRQLVVATTPDLQGYAIEDYGYRLGRAWGLGQKDANNGVILLVAPKERKVRIEVGYGLEPIVTDALSSVIINQTILPRFRDGDMAGGIVAGASAIAEQLKLPLEAAEQRAKAAAAKRTGAGGDDRSLLIAGFWIMVVLFFVVPSIFRRAGGRRFRGDDDDDSGSGGGGRRRSRRGGFVPPVVIWGPGLGGGGGWGGGSGGFGGGSGGFSGGGGSFGGGGASGSW